MDLQARRGELLEAVKTLEDAHQAWVEGDQPWITEELEDAIEDTVVTCAAGAIPADCRELVANVENLGREWEAFAARLRRSTRVAILPGEAFWRALEAVEEAAQRTTAPPKRQLEPIAVLRAQNVSDAQIARMYGFLDAAGAPEPWKVQEELDEPRRHTGEETGWVSPLERRDRQREDEARAGLTRLRERARRRIEQRAKPCPESLEELVQQQVPLEQIARMLRKTPEEVLAECDAAGLPHPAGHVPLTTVQAPQEPDMEPEALEVIEADVRVKRESLARRKAATAPADRKTRRPRPRPARREQAAEVDAEGEEEAAEELQEEAAEEPEAAETGARATDGGPPRTLEHEIIAGHRAGQEPEVIAAALSSEDRPVSVRRVEAILKRFQRNPQAFQSVD